MSDGLAVEQADVIEGGSSDDEAPLAVPDNIPLVWSEVLVGVLLEKKGVDHMLLWCNHEITAVEHFHIFM